MLSQEKYCVGCITELQNAWVQKALPFLPAPVTCFPSPASRPRTFVSRYCRSRIVLPPDSPARNQHSAMQSRVAPALQISGFRVCYHQRAMAGEFVIN
jgi:hypothetical protein